MGLLDDAIREHLELKRQAGADATDVARQAQDALGPVRTDAVPAPSGPDEEHYAEPDVEDGPHQGPYDDEPEYYDEEPAYTPPAPVTPPQPAPLPPPPSPPPPPPGPATDEYRLPAGPEPADVLEQTPDFLQETPEHDRLWFEQAPPQEFDFDK